MKSKVRDEIQPRPRLARRTEQLPHAQAQALAQDEIQRFFQAIDSYFIRITREPRVYISATLAQRFYS